MFTQCLTSFFQVRQKQEAPPTDICNDQGPFIMDLVVEVATNMTRRGSSLPPGSRKASLLSQLPLSRRASVCPGE